jgi:hypothetical protein
MAINLTELTEYVQENADSIVGKAINAGKTLSLFPNYGVRGTGRLLNTMTQSPVGRLSSCGFNDQSETALDQRELKVSHITIDHSICMPDLQKYFTDLARKASVGSYNEDAPFGSQIFDDFVMKVSQLNEIAIWVGNKVSGSGHNALVDGVKTVLTGESFINANTSGYTAVDATNIIDVIDEIEGSIDEEIVERDDLYIFVPIAWYRMYIKAMRDANLYHHDAEMGDFTYKIPSTETTLMGTRGLKGTDEAYAFSLANVAKGIAEGGDKDVEDFRSGFDGKEDKLWMKIKYALGVQFFFPEEVSVFELAAS